MVLREVSVCFDIRISLDLTLHLMLLRLKELSKLSLGWAFAICFCACGNEGGKDSAEADNMTPVTCRWDFSTAERVYEYDYIQSMTLPGVNQDQRIEGEGTLAIRSQGDGTAVVTLMDMIVSSRGESNKMPNHTFRGLKEDGTTVASGTNLDAIIRLLLPLPATALSPGESSKTEFQFPARLNAVEGYAPVYVTIKYDGSDDKEEQGVANFSVKLDSGKAIATTGGEFPEDFHLRLTGEGKIRFSMNQDRHLGSSLTLKIETPSFHNEQPDIITTDISLTPKS